MMQVALCEVVFSLPLFFTHYVMSEREQGLPTLRKLLWKTPSSHPLPQGRLFLLFSELKYSENITKRGGGGKKQKGVIRKMFSNILKEEEVAILLCCPFSAKQRIQSVGFSSRFSSMYGEQFVVLYRCVRFALIFIQLSHPKGI